MLSFRFLLPAGLIVGIVAVYYALTWGSLDAFWIGLDHCAEPFCDFHRHYYPMGREIFVTGDPVPGFFYSPVFALALGIFRLLPLDGALLVWGGLQVVLSLLLVLLPLLFGVRSIRLLLLHLLLVLTGFPVLHNFKWGQVSILLTLALFGSVFLYQRGHRSSAALLLALAISIKFYPALFLLLFLFRWDRPFLLVAGAGAAVLLFVVPFVVLGIDETMGFYHLLRDSLEASRPLMLQNPNSQYLPNVVLRWSAALGFEPRFLPTLLPLLAGAVAAAGFILAYLTLRLERPGTTLWALIVLMLTVPFVVPTSWPHYFVYLPFCQLLLFKTLLEGGSRSRGHSLVIALLVVPSVVCSNVVLFNLTGGGIAYSFLGFPLLADALLLAACWGALGGEVVGLVKERHISRGWTSLLRVAPAEAKPVSATVLEPAPVPGPGPRSS